MGPGNGKFPTHPNPQGTQWNEMNQWFFESMKSYTAHCSEMDYLKYGGRGEREFIEYFLGNYIGKGSRDFIYSLLPEAKLHCMYFMENVIPGK